MQNPSESVRGKHGRMISKKIPPTERWGVFFFGPSKKKTDAVKIGLSRPPRARRSVDLHSAGRCAILETCRTVRNTSEGK